MRRFTAASNERIHMTSLAGFDWRWGTVAAVVNVVSVAAPGTIVSFNDSNAFDLWVTASAELSLFHGSSSATSFGPVMPTGVTCIVGVSKATGSATPRFHVFNSTTNAWTHANGGTAIADGAATTSITIGGYADAAASDQFDGEQGAIAAWPSLAMSDTEFERLARGSWASRSPALLIEFVTAQDSVGDLPRTLGRNRVSQTSRTGTTLGTAGKPAGWRPSVQSRRR